jgi:hypothetical protein
MENFTGLISILLQHSQKFTEFWNFHILVALGVLGFVMSSDGIASKLRMRILMTITFVLIAIYSIFSLSVHQQREVKLWNAINAQVTAAPQNFTPEDREYIESLEPTAFGIKTGALLAADLLVILTIWFAPKIKK